MIEKEIITCDVCHGKKLLWLGGADYVECPQCLASGTIEVHGHRVQARVHTIYIPGQKPFEIVDLPQRTLIADSLIRRD